MKQQLISLLNNRIVNSLMILATLYFGMSAGWVQIKAEIAQWLIAEAWQKTLAQPTQSHAPWTWADMEPVARLRLPNTKEWIVLKGAQGNSLAFGPGLVAGSDMPGFGFSVIGGHRDTHFAALENVHLGQALQIGSRNGEWFDYEITDIRIVDIEKSALVKQEKNSIVLITCYPFESVKSDPNKRWVVTADRLQL